MTIQSLILTIFYAIIFFYSSQALAGEYNEGKLKSFICAECHGEKGVSALGKYPNLSGQKFEYLVSALKAYRSGLRQSEIMNAMVTNLNDQDIKNLATYYSQQDCN